MSLEFGIGQVSPTCCATQASQPLPVPQTAHNAATFTVGLEDSSQRIKVTLHDLHLDTFPYLSTVDVQASCPSNHHVRALCTQAHPATPPCQYLDRGRLNFIHTRTRKSYSHARVVRRHRILKGSMASYQARRLAYHHHWYGYLGHLLRQSSRSYGHTPCMCWLDGCG